MSERSLEQRITRAALTATGLHRSFMQGPREINVLRGANLEIWPGQTVALVGPSGAGKSTLLHILGLLERPDSGSVVIGGEECGALDDAARTRVRRSEVGFIYQFHHLLVEFSAGSMRDEIRASISRVNGALTVSTKVTVSSRMR